jgi:hypothetical protein
MGKGSEHQPHFRLYECTDCKRRFLYDDRSEHVLAVDEHGVAIPEPMQAQWRISPCPGVVLSRAASR